jgi:hypothetical protein
MIIIIITFAKKSQQWHYFLLSIVPQGKTIFRMILCCFAYITGIEKNEISEACRTYGVRRGVYRVVVGKFEGKRTLGRPRRRCGG